MRVSNEEQRSEQSAFLTTGTPQKALCTKTRFSLSLAWPAERFISTVYRRNDDNSYTRGRASTSMVL